MVRSANGAPIAGAEVRAAAPSMTRIATTDASGHFVMLALSPDTYTINLSRSGYENISFVGVTVFADQTAAVAYTMRNKLRTIAHVTTAADSSLVKPGVGR